MRILHFSDIHIGIGLHSVPLSRWLSKRAVGGLNLLLGRNRHFLDARRKVAALARFMKEERIELVVFTGDYTALGFEREFRDARSAVEPLMNAPLGFLNVPGNHDLYVRDVVLKGRFEQHFGDTLGNDMPQYRAAGGWPRVRLLGADTAVVSVNSSRPNPIWRSNGKVSRAELEALRAALRDPVLRERYILIMTHYAPCLANGEPDRHIHGLVNVEQFLAACGGVRRGALLCGHVHRCFHVRLPQFHLPVFCAGSATMDGHEGLWVLELQNGRLRATAGAWDGEGYRLQPDSTLDA